MDLENLLREDFDKIEQYIPEEQPSEAGWIKLNINENPYPPPRVILDEIKMAINDKLRLYPEPTGKDLRKMISSVLLVDKKTLTNPNNIFIDNGADGVLENIMKAFINPGDEVIYFYPTYGLYKTLSTIYKAKKNEIKLNDDFSIPESAYSLKGKLIFINSPNNPNGKAFSNDVILKICKNFPGIVVVDETYGDFSQTTSLPLLKEFKNLMIVRTFSSSFSLASMRIGYAVANDKIIKALNKVGLPYNVNYLAQIAAISCIKHRDLVFKQNQKVISERKRLAEALSKYNGISVEPSDANFIFVKFSDKSICLKFIWDLKEKKVLVRHISRPGLYQYMRITIDTPENNNKFLEIFNELSKKYLQ